MECLYLSKVCFMCVSGTDDIDHLALKGHEITSGYASWVGKEIPDKDSTIIALLRTAGAGMS
jgi:hypothetical protein